jgi:hypothetical protein
MMRYLKTAIAVFVVISSWCLFAIVLVDYMVGDLAGLIETSLQTQAWALLFLFGLWRSSRLRDIDLKVRQWFGSTLLGAFIIAKLTAFRGFFASALRSVYINVYQLADVVFCVGTPLLIISASAGWWLLPEVSYVSLLVYCCMISIIFFWGLHSNLVRLLTLGYFFGYWLVSDSLLMYPFIAPAAVQQNVTLMMTEALNALLPAVGLVLIVYLLARRHGLQMMTELFNRHMSLSAVNGNRQPNKELDRNSSQDFSRDILSNYMLLGCLLMAIPLAAVITHTAISYINVHILFVGLGIWSLDRYWQHDVVDEPALSSDWRYFLKLSWKY